MTQPFFSVADLADQQGLAPKSRARMLLDPTFTPGEVAAMLDSKSVASMAFEAPEVMTPEAWRAMCRDRPCADRGFRTDLCWYCAWAKSIDSLRRAMVGAPESRLDRAATRPRWPNVYAALRSFAEHLMHGMAPPSALGPILDNLRTGAIRMRSGGTTHRVDRTDPIMASVEDFVAMHRALYHAFVDNRWGMPMHECIAICVVRDGCEGKRPTLSEIATELRINAASVRAIGDRGRKALIVELAARGLIPMPSAYLGVREAIEHVRGGFASEDAWNSSSP